MAELTPWVVVALIAAGIVGLVLRMRALGVEVSSAKLDAEKLRGELESTRAQLGKSEARQRRHADEQQALRRKLDKAKKRAGRVAGGPPGAGVARIAELESELEQARQSRDAAREEAAGLGAELSRLRAASKRETPAVEAVAAKPTPPDQPALDEAAAEALRERASSAESDLAAAREQLAESERSVARLRGKLATQESLYVSIRSELAAKKDRLRTQQEEIERLRALKVALVDSPAPDEAAEVPAAADEAAHPGEVTDSNGSRDGEVTTH